MHPNEDKTNSGPDIRLLALVAIVLVAVAMRFIPHWPNFTPIAAIALFGGAHFRNRLAALAVPLAAMMMSDFVLGFSPVTLWVYASFGMIVCLGMLIRRRCSPLFVLGSALGASVLFFVVTNFGWWLSSASYPKTVAGLLLCFEMAVPFFRYTLAGDLFYATLFFGVYAIVGRFVDAFSEWRVATLVDLRASVRQTVGTQ